MDAFAAAWNFIENKSSEEHCWSILVAEFLTNESYVNCIFLIDTCHVEKPNLTVHYKHFPPYVEDPKPGKERPGGILIDLLEEAILHCAYVCHSFPHNVTLVYEKYPTLTNATVSPKNLDIIVPVPMSNKYNPYYEEVKMTKSPGSVLIMVPTGEEELVMTSEEDILKGIFETLPIVGVYFLINALFGAIFWYIVS